MSEPFARDEVPSERFDDCNIKRPDRLPWAIEDVPSVRAAACIERKVVQTFTRATPVRDPFVNVADPSVRIEELTMLAPISEPLTKVDTPSVNAWLLTEARFVRDPNKRDAIPSVITDAETSFVPVKLPESRLAIPSVIDGACSCPLMSACNAVNVPPESVAVPSVIKAACRGPLTDTLERPVKFPLLSVATPSVNAEEVTS